MISYLAHLNVTGQCTAAFYAALETNMLFAKASGTLIRVDHTCDSPYLLAELPELSGLDCVSRLELMLSYLLERLNLTQLLQGKTNYGVECINKIQFIVPQNEQGHAYLSVQQLSELVAQYTSITGVDIKQTHNIECLTKLPPNTLIISADTCIHYEYAIQLKNKVQTIDGPEGMVLGEGACAFICVENSQLNIEITNGELDTQLNNLGATSADKFIFLGAHSSDWQKQWFGLSCGLYHQDEPIINLTNLSSVTGHSGVNQKLMALAAANSYLHNPCESYNQVFLVTNQPNNKVYKISRSDG